VNNTKENISNSTVAKQRNLQAEAAHQNQHIETSQGAMQAGARRYPEPPFPEQHLAKPGEEEMLDPAPMYDAPFYRGSASCRRKLQSSRAETQGLAAPWRCFSLGKVPTLLSFIWPSTAMLK
jgi:hypothetical protein